MKISWPWRKKEPLSLFENRIPWLGKDLHAKPHVLPSGVRTHDPHPLNAPGGFFVENHECMACGVPHTVAPDLMAWESKPGDPHTHCYFKKQPEGPAELRQALNAIDASCCGALCYAGSETEVLRELRKSGNANAIVRK